ncbi:MAG: dehydrogenase E1 component subunit alpha/beta [Burkholderiales bacterium]
MNAPLRDGPQLDADALRALWRQMVLIRRFDERVRELFLEGVVKGTAHSCVGQEAIAAGTCAALRETDFVISHHRGHGHCIAKGAEPRRMMAELMGRIDGYCRGLGGSMHVADLSRNILGANGVVGAGIGIGTGAALAAQLRGGEDVGVAFFGDGAANEGIFHEALNLASLWKLPIVYLCENNQYGLSTSIAESTSIDRLSRRAASYSMPAQTIDGNDVEAVHAAVRDAVTRARAGDGPTLIEALTYRWGEHSMRANLPAYRSEDEEAEWRSRDPIARLGATLAKVHAVPPDWFDATRKEVEAEIAAAEAFGRASPEPQMEDLAGAVTSPHHPHPDPILWPGAAPLARKLTFAEAIREALAIEMRRDASVVLLGEDIGRIGGIFAVTRGLIDEFGAARVRDTPISEAAIALAGVGAAISGSRPVVEVQIFDFVTLMMDALVNQAAKFRFMLGGAARVPLVVRGPTGGGVRLAAQHSQSLESWLAHVPGLVVLAPGNAYDAKGLMLAALRDDNPVVFLEHKLAYLAPAQPVPEGEYVIPIGKAAVRRPGTHCTVVATMTMVDKALAAAAKLAREGIECEVIDPRTLRPLDADTILQSVRKTSRLVIAHEGWKHYGFGAEVSALVAEHAIDWLDGPIVRVTSRDLPMPYNDHLERATLPQEADIFAAVRSLVLRDRIA